MREIRTSGSEGGVSKPIDAPYPYQYTLVGGYWIARSSRATTAIMLFDGDTGVDDARNSPLLLHAATPPTNAASIAGRFGPDALTTGLSGNPQRP